MASTVPGIDREKTVAAKLGVGLQNTDLSTLAAPTISLSPLSPGLKLGRLRRLDTGQTDRARDASPDNGDGFAATLAKAIAARKAANDRTSRVGATRQPRVEARAEREHAVRDVVRQLKQLVEAAREAKDGTPVVSPKQAGQAIAQRDSTVDATTLQGVFQRLSGTEAERAARPGVEDPSLTPDAEVQALVQTVADAIAVAMGPDGELDEAALAAALIADPLFLAAAESLIAALQAQLVTAIQVALPAVNAEGDSVAGGDVSGGTHQAVVAAAVVPAADAPASVEASTTPVVSLSSAPVVTEVVALDAPAPDVATEQATAASSSPVLAEARVASEAAVSVAAASEPRALLDEASAPTQPTTTSAPEAAASAISIAAQTDGAAATENVTVHAAAASVQSTAETTSLTGAIVEASVPKAASGGEDAVVSDPVNGTAHATVLTQATSGQNGAQTSPDGQTSDRDGGDASNAGTTSVPAARSNGSATQAATQINIADADGAATSPSGSNAQSTVSTTVNTSPSVNAGATAPAQRAEAVAQTQGAQDAAPDVDLHEQVSPVIVRQARLMSVDGGHELTVRLNPDHLGPLHVRISLLEGTLSVGLTTANAEAQRALENALPQLRGALVESGLRLDRLDVGQRDAGNGGNGSSGNQRGSANAGRGGGNQPGYAGNGSGGSQTDPGSNGPSFADVLLDQDGRAFGSATRTSRWMGYRAYRRG